jgi:hypothetical protein
MSKSLTETAKAILMKEQMDSNPDRDAKNSNENMATLKPGSKAPEADPKHNEAQDLGPALVKNTDTPPSAKAAEKMGKTASRPADKKEAGEPAKKSAEMMEEDVAEDEELEVVAEEEVVAESEELEEDFEISEEMAAFIDAMLEEGATEEEIAAALEENFTFESEEEVVSEEAEEEVAYEVDMQEHVDALFQGEELSEEFKAKALTIFEAAVKQKVEAEIALMEQAFAETLEEEVASIQEELSSNVDDYLNYVVEQWVSDNEVAIESGLRTELTEDFISGLKTLFAEHYIDLPEDKVSVVEELGNKVSELEEKLNEEIERSVTLSKQLNESKKFEVIANAVDGLTATQAEKMKSLAEGVEFTDLDQFSAKVKTIRENYFPGNSVKSENVLDKAESSVDGKGMIAEELQGPMANYVKALGKKLPN